MAYEKTIWRNREVENPRTFNLQNNSDGTVTLMPAEGTIIESGTPIIAANMNNIEEGIEAAHSGIMSHSADGIKHIGYATASGANIYTVYVPGIESLDEGLSLKIKFTNANTGAATLNINELGAKAIQKSNGGALSSSNIKAGQIVHLAYTGSVFQLLGDGGEYGTAAAGEVLSGYTLGTESGIVNGYLALTGDAVTANVLAGKTFYNTDARNKITGTMPNHGAVNQPLAINGSYTIPAGYHNGAGKVTQSIPTKAAATITPGTSNQTIAAGQYLSGAQTISGSANLVAGNIKSGINIFGVVGSLAAPTIRITANPATQVDWSSDVVALGFYKEYPSPYLTIPKTENYNDRIRIRCHVTGTCTLLVRYYLNSTTGNYFCRAYKNGVAIGYEETMSSAGTWRSLTINQPISVTAGDLLGIRFKGTASNQDMNINYIQLHAKIDPINSTVFTLE